MDDYSHLERALIILSGSRGTIIALIIASGLLTTNFIGNKLKIRPSLLFMLCFGFAFLAISFLGYFLYFDFDLFVLLENVFWD